MAPKEVTDESRKIVEQIVKDGLIWSIINTITDNGKLQVDPSALEDLHQDLCLSLLENPKLPALYEKGEHRYYITRMVLNNIISSDSPYYRHYLKFRHLSDPLPKE